ncbi:hypothetical protein [Paenibacillus glycanilyticus]|uniref:Uncharacterized protein n=1 Tax=Paenibacillus glycanilyticus TaxID=126569 RepID=A0ABQ6GKP9_9BACL|nr:hypothetical protein [Paenibacillus glycanilyticus]GLX69933.1 hypothetical protein MU1_42790 [Paenibacillus glycanilyticus]
MMIGDTRKKMIPRWLKGVSILLACLILFAGLVYAYDKPGGIADWRYSRAAGLEGTIQIPIGKTPEEAVQKFRSSSNLQIVHKESLHGGDLLFYKQNGIKDENLGIEFVHKTWMGWKWVMGGGYAVSAPFERKEAFSFMSMPKYKGITGPFPIIYGLILDSSITKINVTVGGTKAGSYPASITEYEPGQRLWYAELPASSTAPYKITATGDNGKVLAVKSFDDPTGYGSVAMSKSKT